MNLSRSHRLTIKYFTICGILVLITFGIRPLLHAIEGHRGALPFWVWDAEYPLCTLMNISIAVLWGYQTYQRIIQRVQRRMFCAIAYCMASWFTISLAQYTFFSADDPLIQTISRHLWYGYFLPWMLIPLLFLLIAFYIGKSDREKIDRRLLLLWIPYGLINLGIMTNDLHQQAFRFPSGIECWQTDYTRGWLFYLAYLWIFLLSVIGVAVIRDRTRVPSIRKYCIIPLFTLGIGQVLTLLAVNDIFYLHVAECCILAFGLTFEACIRANLIPNNVHYPDLIRFPEFRIYIYDDQHQLSSKPDGAEDLPDTGGFLTPYMLDDCHRVSSTHVYGGYVSWVEDETEVRRLRREMEEVRELLKEESSLIREENELKKRRISVSIKRNLYDSISAFSTPLVNRMEKELDELNLSENPNALAHICIQMAYLKRRSNMVLKQQENGTLPLEELYNAIYEPFSYLEYLGIYGYPNGRLTGTCDGDLMIAFYDMFNDCMSAVYCNLSAVLVNLMENAAKSEVTLHIMMSLKEDTTPDQRAELLDQLNALTCEWPEIRLSTSYEEDEGTIYAILTMTEGGAA